MAVAAHQAAGLRRHDDREIRLGAAERAVAVRPRLEFRPRLERFGAAEEERPHRQRKHLVYRFVLWGRMMGRRGEWRSAVFAYQAAAVASSAELRPRATARA